MAQKTVLLVEDDLEIRDILQDLLEAEGYDVVPASHAPEKKLYGTRPHMINTAKCGVEVLGNILVKTKVSTPIITMGFRTDHNTPRDMFR